MNRNSHQQQHHQHQSVDKENLLKNGRYFHDQAIGMAIMKMLSSSSSADQHEPKTWHCPQQMKYS